MKRKQITLGMAGMIVALLLAGPAIAGAIYAEGETNIDAEALMNSASVSAEVRSEIRPEYQNATPEERVEMREEYRAERAEMREALKVRLETLRQEKAEMREERVNGTTTLSVRAQTNIENFANGLFARLEAALEKLDGIAERLAEKIEEHEEEGNEMGVSSELLANANLKLEAAEVAQTEADLAMEAMLGAEVPREMLDEVRTELQEAKQALLEAKQALLDVVKQIRLDISAEAEAEAELEN